MCFMCLVVVHKVQVGPRILNTDITAYFKFKNVSMGLKNASVMSDTVTKECASRNKTNLNRQQVI